MTVASAAQYVGISLRLNYSPERLFLKSEIESAAKEVAGIHADLDGVIATIDPSEWARAALATGGPWPAARLASQWVENYTPWQSGASPWAPVTMTRALDHANGPHDFLERCARIPTGSERVRIDRFDTPNGPRFEVYLAGTDFTAGPNNPWWVGANAEMLASGASRSISAAESALEHAGVTGTTPIVLTGHSQGGAIALALAGSGRYEVEAVFTIGTPAGVVDSPDNVPIINVVHTEDPVPALGGDIRGTKGTTWIVHTEPRLTGTDAHLAVNYQDSLRRLEILRDPRLIALENRLHIDSPGTAMWFRATLAGD